jgi:hypothetical protein
MLPAPARIAAPPRPKSTGFWNPAVPTPPVAGAPMAIGLVDGLGVAGCDAERLALASGVATFVVPLGGTVAVAEPLPPGEKVAGVGEGDDVAQAARDAEASVARVAQAAAVILALSPVPALVARIFMGSPHASGQVTNRFPVLASREIAIVGKDMQWPVRHRNIRLRD